MDFYVKNSLSFRLKNKTKQVPYYLLSMCTGKDCDNNLYIFDFKDYREMKNVTSNSRIWMSRNETIWGDSKHLI